MTVRKRLFWSNLLMILVPALITALVGLFCIGLILLLLVHGTSLGIRNQEDFQQVAVVTAEAVEKRLEQGDSLDRLQPLLERNGMSLVVLREGEPYAAYGESQPEDAALLAAAQLLPGDATLASNGRSLYVRQETVQGQAFTTCLFGGYPSGQSLKFLKLAIVA